jgi:hypothetical protein
MRDSLLLLRQGRSHPFTLGVPAFMTQDLDTLRHFLQRSSDRRELVGGRLKRCGRVCQAESLLVQWQHGLQKGRSDQPHCANDPALLVVVAIEQTEDLTTAVEQRRELWEIQLHVHMLGAR